MRFTSLKICIYQPIYLPVCTLPWSEDTSLCPCRSGNMALLISSRKFGLIFRGRPSVFFNGVKSFSSQNNEVKV